MGKSLEVNESVSTLDKKSAFRKILALPILISVGYMDPGNWATDLAGGQFGYSTWVLLMSNIMALLLQSLSAQNCYTA
jgi:manganese transport protein